MGRRPSFFNIQRKLIALTFSVVVAVVIALTLYFSARHVDVAERSLTSKGQAYAGLLAKEVESAVAFDDQETAREVFAATALDTDVSALALYGSHGQLLAANGTLRLKNPVKAAAAAGGSAGIRTVRRDDRIELVTTVVSKEGPRGVLVLEMSTSAIHAETVHVVQTALIAGALALALGLFAAWFLSRSIAGRLLRIQNATNAFAESTANADKTASILSSEVGKADEIAQLAGDFNTMATRIRDLVESIGTAAAEEKARLDRLVTLRTAELTTRNEDLRFLLDNADQGFVTIDKDGRLSAERSTVLAQWFGESAGPDVKLWEYVGRNDQRARNWLAVGWEPLFDGGLPFELAMDQLPKEINDGDRTFAVDYKAIFAPPGSENVKSVIVVITDATAERARCNAEAAQQELASLFSCVVNDPASLHALLDEGSVIIEAIQMGEQNLETLRRSFHTLKGNAAFFGLTRLATVCHDLESHMADSGEAPSQEASAQLISLWREFQRTAKPLLGHRNNHIEIKKADLEALAASIANGTLTQRDISRTVQDWMLEPMDQRLERVAEQARSAARKVGKRNVEVVLEPNDVKLSAEDWSPFWSALIHVVRNAVDHGIEDDYEREVSGKTGHGKITLRTFQTRLHDVVEVEDDGRGINWSALRERAQDLGVDVALVSDEDLLFLDGLSTKTEASETSGRGVGLGAIQAVCKSMGGRVQVNTTLGAGTRFVFRIPRKAEPFARMSIPITSLSSTGRPTAPARA